MNEWGGGSNNNDIKIICLLYFILFLEKKNSRLGRDPQMNNKLQSLVDFWKPFL